MVDEKRPAAPGKFRLRVSFCFHSFIRSYKHPHVLTVAGILPLSPTAVGTSINVATTSKEGKKDIDDDDVENNNADSASKPKSNDETTTTTSSSKSSNGKRQKKESKKQ